MLHVLLSEAPSSNYSDVSTSFGITLVNRKKGTIWGFKGGEEIERGTSDLNRETGKMWGSLQMEGDSTEGEDKITTTKKP